MTLRSLRLCTAVVAVLALAAPAAALSASSYLTNDQGIVQSVGPAQIELRALDGSIASFTVSEATRVRLNGEPARLADIRPGHVATVTHDGGRPAVLIRAFGRPPLIASRGVVAALTRNSITIGSDAGPITIPLDRATVFRFRGGPGFRWQARPGALVVVKHRDGRPAKSVNVLKRARA
ncbi:hypothetical protein [Gaiella sp.]|uniref:hypothetical protein n=1 Tax=Gaiella sp. TaxID=2663207 RepID=UPI0032643317